MSTPEKLRLYLQVYSAINSGPALGPKPDPDPLPDKPGSSIVSGGLRAEIESVSSTTDRVQVTMVILLRNIGKDSLIITAIQGISGIGDNGRRYVSGPGGIAGIASCNSNLQGCLRYITQGVAGQTRVEPNEEIRVQAHFYKQNLSNDVGVPSALNSLIIPFAQLV